MPKGYNDRAIKGLLEYTKGVMECVLQDVKEGKPLEQALKEELQEIESRLKGDYRETTTSFEKVVG